MSNSGNRKSMDDVLASIRRIVRTEVPPAGETEAPPPAPEGPADDGALDLTPDMLVDDAPDAPDADMTDNWQTPTASGMAPDAPDPGDRAEDLADRISSGVGDIGDRAGEAAQDVVEAGAALVPGAAASGPVLAPALDRADLEALIRETIRDELWNGETGRNISDNVMQLIRDEVARQLGR